MQRWISQCGVSSLVALATFVWPSLAGAVVVSFGTPPELYAVTFLYEDWAAHSGTPSGFLDNTEQETGSQSASSLQQAGIDALPNPSCTPPCTGLTAKAKSGFEAGGLALSSLSHAYGDFDQVASSGDPPNTVYFPGYGDGNIVQAEANAAVLDVLTVTRPVQIEVRGRLVGECSYSSSSATSEPFADDLPVVDFGHGRVTATIVVELISDSLFFHEYPVTINLSAPFDTVVPHDEEFSGSATLFTPGDYVLKAQLRTEVRIGSVTRATLAEQSMTSDFAHTATFRLVADDPSAVSSASGKLSFTAAPEPSVGVLEGLAALALALRSRRARSQRARRGRRASRA